jgi:hypothetical protein
MPRKLKVSQIENVLALYGRTLLSTPRFGPALPNAAGTHALHTISSYSFESHSSSNEICIIDVKSRKSRVVTKDDTVSEPNWLGVDDLFVYLSSEEDGKTSLIVHDARDTSKY